MPGLPRDDFGGRELRSIGRSRSEIWKTWQQYFGPRSWGVSTISDLDAYSSVRWTGPEA